MNDTDTRKIQVQLVGRDFLELTITKGKSHLKYVGCYELHELMQSNRKNYGDSINNWPLPEGRTHSELLLKEFILKITQKWNYPYSDEELCHCRNVRTEVVDQAILAGAHSTEMVSLWTSASTACGTCRPQVEKLIKYRLEGK